MKLDLSKAREIENLEFLAKQLVEGFITGLHSSPYHGFSVEFAEHKLYNPGESTRHIDWKVYGKSDKLYTKRYEEETNLRCQIIIDTSSSMYYPVSTNGKLIFSIVAAASLAYLLQRQKDAVGVTTFSENIELQTPIKSTTSHIHTLFLQLQNLLQQRPHNKKSSVATVLHAMADKINKRSLIILFSDMFDNMSEEDHIFSALQHLKHNNHEVLIFHVIDKKTEIDFAFEEKPYEFIDVETGEKIKLQASQVKEYYRESINNHLNNLTVKCGQSKISFVAVDINESVHHVLLSYLTKRAKMK